MWGTPIEGSSRSILSAIEGEEVRYQVKSRKRRGLGDVALAMPRQIMGNLTASSRIADMDHVFQVEMSRECGEVVGVGVHDVAIWRSG